MLAKSIQHCARERPGVAKIVPKSTLGLSRATKVVPGTSRERPGAFPGRSRRDPRAFPERQGAPRDTKKVSQERPGVRRNDLNRRRVASGSSKNVAFARDSSAKRARRAFEAIYRRFWSIFGVFAKRANPLKYRTCQKKQGVRPFAQQVDNCDQKSINFRQANCNFDGHWSSVDRSKFQQIWSSTH